MAFIDVIHRSSGEIFKTKIDQEDFDRLSKYKYFISNIIKKPFREATVKNKICMFSLARDVMGLKYRDGRVVYYENNDFLDCRKSNFVEGKTRVSNKKINVGDTTIFWPHTFKSFINFLDTHKGDDEELVTPFLVKANKVKYSFNLIALTFMPEDYAEFQMRQVLIAFKRILHKYFNWKGEVIAVKDLTIDYKNEIIAKGAVPAVESQKDTPMVQRVFEDLNSKVEDKIISFEEMKQLITTFNNVDQTNETKLLQDTRIFTLEALLDSVNFRMSHMTLQFISK